MTFNTGNPVGSTDPRDLSDNAQNFDKLSVGSEHSYPDRFGVPRKSWAGMEADFTEFLAASGFESEHLTYIDGQPLVVARPTQLIDYEGSVYRVKMPASFPLELSGVWASDAPLLLDVGDQSLRLALANEGGASLIGFSDVGSFPDGTAGRAIQQRARVVADVAALSLLAPAVGAAQLVSGERSGLFVYQTGDFSSQVAADPQGSVYVAPASSPIGAAGAWVRVDPQPFRADWSGSDLNDIPAFVAGDVLLTEGSYSGSASVVNRPDLRFVAAGQSLVNGLPLYKSRFSGAIKPPAGFPWQPPLFITEKAGTYSTIFDIAHYDRASRDPTAVHYYVNVTGNNGGGNDGRSPETAYRSVYWAIRQAGLAGVTNLILHVGRGVYNRHDGWMGERFSGNISVLCEEGTYLTTAERYSDLSWTSLGGDVYSVVRSGISSYRGIVDMKYRDMYGKPYMYTPVESASAVAGNPGSYYVDAATNTVSVCMRDGRAPDTDLLVLSSSSTGNGRQADGTGFLYVKNARFVGGGGGAFFTGAGAGVVACFDSCEFAFSSNNAGLRSLDTGLTISYNCDAYLNYSDGFNYHDYGPVGARVIEIDCRSWWNGLYRPSSEPENVNGSSAHESVEIVRVNTQAWENTGPNIVDIQTVNCWNVGCKAWDSLAVAAAQKVDFYFTDSNVTAWLDGCEGGLTGKQLATNPSSVAYVRNWGGGLSASGNIQTY